MPITTFPVTPENEASLKLLPGVDFDALAEWRLKNPSLASKDNYGRLVCPLTRQSYCENCGWTLSGPCYCDTSYG